MLKYSKQREAIKNFIYSRDDHPTADTIYLNIRSAFPNISLGTVYRNLSLLVSIGEIAKISYGNGADHFDWDTSSHYHFICTECGCVYNLPMETVEDMNSLAKRYFNGIIDGHSTYFYGKCENCLRNFSKNS